MNEVEIIRGAREILSDPKRWTKRNWKRCDSYCIEGALGMAACNNPLALLYEDAPDELRRAEDLLLQRARRPGLGDLAGFNDSSYTTHQDVLDLLDKVLADLGGLL